MLKDTALLFLWSGRLGVPPSILLPDDLSMPLWSNRLLLQVIDRRPMVRFMRLSLFFSLSSFNGEAEPIRTLELSKPLPLLLRLLPRAELLALLADPRFCRFGIISCLSLLSRRGKSDATLKIVSFLGYGGGSESTLVSSASINSDWTELLRLR